MSEAAPNPALDAPKVPKTSFGGGTFGGLETDATWQSRFVWAILFSIPTAVVITALLLTPNPHGHGTHTQLHLPSCPWPQTVGGPCPTCGMTTAFAFAADGRFLRSFLTQPCGFALALMTAAGSWGLSS